MPTLSITFNSSLNTSLQIGDTAYYVPTNPVPNNSFNTASQPNMIKIGDVVNVLNPLGSNFVLNFTMTINHSGGQNNLTLSNTLTQITPGMLITGQNIAPGTIITAWTSGNATLSLPTTGPVANGDIITINTAPAEIHIFNPANPIPQPTPGDFIMFAKNRVVNTSGIIGYYADIKLVNHTTKKAEMFAISSGIIESSK
tara:strand:+ start:2491 stop:3087 length:597 start_codon:yes stop_codon:yes gene_type:complete